MSGLSNGTVSRWGKIAQILANADTAVPIAVKRVTGAKVLWSSLTKTENDRVLAASVRISTGASEQAWADRYGGYGIGGNGGSGRAAVYRGLYVKGVGPTPLIGATTNSHHLSGGAYLEEAVRETIFAEVFAHELPWGAVRTSAIVDTLEDERFPPDPESDLPRVERRVLIIREPVLRPAHLQRAIHFTGERQLVGAADVRRVAKYKELLRCDAGYDLSANLRQMWLRWCDQVAYSYVWRLSQGAPSTSNIALDGRLVDFGASTTLPDWCAAVIFSGAPEHGHDLGQIVNFIDSFYAEHKSGELTEGKSFKDYAAGIIDECRHRYWRKVGYELLRVTGLRGSKIEEYCQSKNNATKLENAAACTANWYLRKFRMTIEASPSETLWDIIEFWGAKVPSHLRHLRKIADDIAAKSKGEPVFERMRMRCVPRPSLSREVFRRRLHAKFSHISQPEAADARLIQRIIKQEALIARRDSLHEPQYDVLYGFVSTEFGMYSLFKDRNSISYAILEVPNLKLCGNIGGDESLKIIGDDLIKLLSSSNEVNIISSG